MPSQKLTAKFVASAPSGRHGDGMGLWLVVSPAGAKRWVYRFTISGKVSEKSLGSLPEVALSDAREKAFEARKLHKAGVSPTEHDRKLRAEAAREAAKPTFGIIANEFIEMKGPTWRNPKSPQQWRNTINQHASNLIHLLVDEITPEHVLAALQPIWTAKPETASRLRGRVEQILDYAKAKKHRDGDNPAAWKGNLKHLLPAQNATKEHHASMPYSEVPDFVSLLRSRADQSCRALEFLILCGGRTNEITGARWEEIDTEGQIWTVPAERMKTGKPHLVPLSKRAVEILTEAKDGQVNDFVFPGLKKGQPISNGTMDRLLERLGYKHYTVHGFRSSFRDFAGDKTEAEWEVAEASLSHQVGNKVSQAYRRSSALEKRRTLMERWAKHCSIAAKQ